MNCIYKDPSEPIEARIKDLLSRMTLKEKVGQMTQIERRKTTTDTIKDLSIGIHTLSVSLKFLHVCVCICAHVKENASFFLIVKPFQLTLNYTFEINKT